VRSLIAFVVVIGCAPPTPPIQAPSPAPALAAADEIGTIPPAVDLTGAWTTGSRDGEPQVRTVVTHTECANNPAAWVIEQRGDSIRVWAFPETFNEGVATKGPGPARITPATGRISGVEVRINDAESHYRLRYDAESHHLRGTLNGRAFWAVRQIVVRPGACGAIPQARPPDGVIR
jgi:hypothetical protein